MCKSDFTVYDKDKTGADKKHDRNIQLISWVHRFPAVYGKTTIQDAQLTYEVNAKGEKDTLRRDNPYQGVTQNFHWWELFQETYEGAER